MKITVTERLLIRSFHPADGDDLYAYLSDSEVVRYEPYAPLTREQARMEARDRAGKPIHRAVVLLDDSIPPGLRTPGIYEHPHVKLGQVIGNLYLLPKYASCELGFVFARQYWGMGYAAEAARALIDEAFSGGAEVIHAHCLPENERSVHLLERLGFKHLEGTRILMNIPGDDGEVSAREIHAYAMLREEQPHS